MVDDDPVTRWTACDEPPGIHELFPWALAAADAVSRGTPSVIVRHVVPEDQPS